MVLELLEAASSARGSARRPCWRACRRPRRGRRRPCPSTRSTVWSSLGVDQHAPPARPRAERRSSAGSRSPARAARGRSRRSSRRRARSGRGGRAARRAAGAGSPRRIPWLAACSPAQSPREPMHRPTRLALCAHGGRPRSGPGDPSSHAPRALGSRGRSGERSSLARETLSLSRRSPRPGDPRCADHQAAGRRARSCRRRAAEIGIASLGDLLRHLPHCYRDRAAPVGIGELRLGEEATVEVEVTKAGKVRPTRRRRLTILEADVRDESGA